MQPLFEKHQLGVYASFDEAALIEKTLINWFVNNDLPQPSKSIASYERNVIAQKYLDLIRLLT
jgi:hypothetical protein